MTKEKKKVTWEELNVELDKIREWWDATHDENGKVIFTKKIKKDDLD